MTAGAHTDPSARRHGVVERVTGRLKFAADLAFPGLLHARLVTLPCAHARIRAVDAGAALRRPGVRAVLTGADLPRPIPRYGPVVPDRPVLAADETLYFGDPVAIVAAESEAEAAEAAASVRVEYEELPGVYTIEDALAPGAPLVQAPAIRGDNPWRDTNIYGEWRFGWGDAAAASAPLEIEGTYRFPMQAHFAIEPHVFVAAPGDAGGVSVWSTVQHPYPLQRCLHEALGLPLSKIRVVGTEMGGAFGGKGYPKFEPLVAWLALRAGRPVRLRLSLEESFLAGRRAACRVRIVSGFERDGRLVFQRATADYLIGPFADISARFVSKTGYLAGGAYAVPHADVTARAVFSHTPPATAYRGFGAPQYLWAVESQLNEAARRLGLDALEIRLRNLPEKGAVLVPGDTPVDGDWRAGLRRAAEAIGWGTPKKPGRGRGLAIGIKTPRPGATAQAIVRLHPDGSASVLAGTTEMGQGAQTVLLQLAAHGLGLPRERIRIVNGDTDAAPFDAITASSRSTVCMGNAVLAACADVRRKLAAMAAETEGAPPEAVTVGDGVVTARGVARSYAQVVGAYYGAGEGQVVGLGEFRQPRDPQHPLGGPAIFYEIIFLAAEVEVDPETGQYEVADLATCADVGKAINPRLVEGQDEGGAMMSVGQAMMEHLVLDAKGIPRNLGALDYRIPTAMDIPRRVQSFLIENGDGPGPFGAKGVGESGAISVAAAIAEAVTDATGVRFFEPPLTAERVWRGLQELARTKGSGRAEEAKRGGMSDV